MLQMLKQAYNFLKGNKNIQRTQYNTEIFWTHMQSFSKGKDEYNRKHM